MLFYDMFTLSIVWNKHPQYFAGLRLGAAAVARGVVRGAVVAAPVRHHLIQQR